MGACSCRKGTQRDNCPACEGTGVMIDFNALRKAYCADHGHAVIEHNGRPYCNRCGLYLKVEVE